MNNQRDLLAGFFAGFLLIEFVAVHLSYFKAFKKNTIYWGPGTMPIWRNSFKFRKICNIIISNGVFSRPSFGALLKTLPPQKALQNRGLFELHKFVRTPEWLMKADRSVKKPQRTVLILSSFKFPNYISSSSQLFWRTFESMPHTLYRNIFVTHNSPRIVIPVQTFERLSIEKKFKTALEIINKCTNGVGECDKTSVHEVHEVLHTTHFRLSHSV